MNWIDIKDLLKSKKKIIKNSKILCIGDIILDHDVHGIVDRISPEAPIPILLFKNETYNLGGVGNVARNIASFKANADLFFLSGKDTGTDIINLLIKKEININKINVPIENFKVPIKTRYKNKFKQLIRVDKEDINFYLNKKNKAIILKKLNNIIKKYNIIILSDYNKGFLDKELIQNIVKIANKHNVNIIADPKKIDLSAYKNINLITPNEKEITDAAQKKILNETEIVNFSQKIMKKNNIANILITRSEKGMMLVTKNDSFKLKTSAKNVIDVTGAGDTVIALLALMLSIGFSTKESMIISNYAAGLVISKRGTEVINYNDLFR